MWPRSCQCWRFIRNRSAHDARCLQAPAPYPIPYDFINMAGDTKKMSASKGTGLDAVEGATISMPAEVVRYFVLGSAPSKRLYFDPVGGL
ncbi:hypothetical protein IPL68_04730 [Candidatus Saccharibacteria bacterium]|nr:MAG: hypothetical protein IPL68_04730 [Candidatus Saccharibacteria bacterium]